MCIFGIRISGPVPTWTRVHGMPVSQWSSTDMNSCAWHACKIFTSVIFAQILHLIIFARFCIWLLVKCVAASIVTMYSNCENCIAIVNAMLRTFNYLTMLELELYKLHSLSQIYSSKHPTALFCITMDHAILWHHQLAPLQNFEHVN